MDTLEHEEPATPGADTDTPDTELPDGSAPSDTPDGGEPEDADDVETLKKRIADKDKHIGKLEKQLQDQPKPKSKPTAQNAVSEEDALWLIENAAALKMCKPEYQAYIAKGYAKSDALYLARRDKGLTKSEAKPTAETPAPAQGEHRASKPKRQLTASQRANGITQEMLDKYGPEVEAKIKK